MASVHLHDYCTFKLSEMGFSIEQCTAALLKAKGNLSSCEHGFCSFLQLIMSHILIKRSTNDLCRERRGSAQHFVVLTLRLAPRVMVVRNRLSAE